MKIVTNDIRDLKQWLFNKEKTTVISFEDFIKHPQKADLVYFSGGEDVSPYIYNEDVHPRTYSHAKRDILEMRVYSTARELDVPCFGICRGSQLLTAVQPGGRLVQDVSGHSGYGLHDIKCGDIVVAVTSTHHQMMYPFNVANYELLAVSSQALSKYYAFGDPRGDEEDTIIKHGEPEIVFYPDTKCLGVQGHPEYFQDGTEPFPALCKKLVFEKCLS